MKKNNGNKQPPINAKTMGRAGMKAIKDLAFGNYDFYKEGHVFRNPEFVKATIAEVDKKLYNVQVILNALNYAYGNSEELAIKSLIDKTERSCRAYMFIRQQLCSTLTTGDTGFLLILPKILGPFKYNI